MEELTNNDLEVAHENELFNEWSNSITSPHAYLMSGCGKTYAGIKKDDKTWCFVFDDNMETTKARLHRCFKKLITNRDDNLNAWDRDELGACRKTAEKQYKIDVGLGYQFKSRER